MKRTIPGRSLKLIHTSDLHLGCDYLGDLPREAIRAVVDAACAQDADVILLAGDLFDHNRVSDEEVAFLLTELERFRGTSVVLPGNHDCFDSTSVYRRPVFDRRPPFVHLLADAGQPCLLPGLDLQVWGRPVIDHCRAFRPLSEVPSAWQASWRVVMGHGHFELPGAREPRSSPISPEEIGAAACDYLALGHWDVCADVSQGSTIAFYSGAPYSAWNERGLTHALLVHLDVERGISVDMLPLASPSGAVPAAGGLVRLCQGPRVAAASITPTGSLSGAGAATA